MMKNFWIVGLLLVVVLSGVGLAKEIVVTSTADSGTGSFRWALQTARSGDVITFDPGVFPPSAPATIYPRSELPPITCGGLTIDASNAGVILNGGKMTTHEGRGLVVRSDGNTIQGLQIVSFAGSAIVLVGASHNLIGGDRAIGTGPVGQGNVLCGSNPGAGLAAWERPSSHNRVAGNLIGTDATGKTPCPNVDGVFLVDGAKDNIIGPDNVIAYNREHGVVIGGSDSLGNTITRNSIHDNAWGGIQLLEKGNAALSPPLLMGCDLKSGILRGGAPPCSVVEIFSGTGRKVFADKSEPGGVFYEGKAIADQHGYFTFDKAGALLGLSTTATATDPRGNTSEFARSISGCRNSLDLQVGTTHVPLQLQPKKPHELEDNRIGQLAGLVEGIYLPADVERFVDQHLDLGLKWYRLALDDLDWWEVVERGVYSRDTVDPNSDAVISALVDNGVRIMLDLVYWDDRIPTDAPPERRFATEWEIQAYLDYVRSVVRHFRGRVGYYEFLNEPDVRDPGQYVEVDDYIELVRRAIPVIRSEDPTARLVAGAVTPLHDPVSYDYLFSILRSDIMPLIDGISWHIDHASPELEYLRDYYYSYPQVVQTIRDTAIAHGFSGDLFATELRFRTSVDPHPTEYWGYREIPSAKYHARGIVTNLGLDLIMGVALGDLNQLPYVVRVIKNLSTVMAGHEAIDMPVEILIDFEPTAYCAFRYPNGDCLLAVWTDAVAVDDDPGKPATVTFPGLTAGTVTGIDVLHGFEQELVYETDGNDTIIHNLLVKDYPVLIRLSDVTMSPDYVETVGDGFHRLGEAGGNPTGGVADRDGDGIPDDEDYCPDWPGSKETNGC